MSETVLIEAINTMPAILWVFFALIAFLALRGTILTKLGDVSKVTARQVELTFATKLLDETAEGGGGNPPTVAEKRAVVSRVEHALDHLRGGRLLWVDDNPAWNRPLIDLLQRIDMTVDAATSTAEAMTMVRSRRYDLVITDMHRDTEDPAETAGLSLVVELRQSGTQLPVILFTLGFDPQRGVDPGIFAYTSAADELIHLVIDVMERVRFRAAI